MATKADIKKAVEQLFNVRVLDVRTQLYKGKPRRFKMRLGRTGDWKKAIVKLHAEDNIAFF
jgi:large subunit ribosomal protein L23